MALLIIKKNKKNFMFLKLNLPKIKKILKLYVLCVLLSSHTLSTIDACGPGKGIGSRRLRNKVTPLVYKQHEPNQDEYSIRASGPITGPIPRNHTKFPDLRLNYNRDIEFRDDEGSGADHVMTQRCNEKLNTLALLVMNNWPTVHLRVIEAWDEEFKHGSESLHYEGRAVDVQTSDRDRSKNGMLARLAVEAGFDWVYYEGKGHIHCSVKPDSAFASHSSGCFTGISTVTTSTGATRKLNELQIGEKVLSMDTIGNPIYSEVIMFMDRDISQQREFIKITTDNGATISITPAHLLMISESINGTTKYIFAENIEIGDYVLVHLNNTLTQRKVIHITTEIHTGVYAPLTKEGTIIVNSILASCYALVDSQSIAHFSFMPIRLMYSIRHWFSYPMSSLSTSSLSSSSSSSSTSLSSTRSLTESIITEGYGQNGIHWYAKILYSIKDYCLPSHWIYQT